MRGYMMPIEFSPNPNALGRAMTEEEDPILYHAFGKMMGMEPGPLSEKERKVWDEYNSGEYRRPK